MRQFDLHRNPSIQGRQTAPLLVVLSSHHLQGLDDVVVAPLVNDARRTLGELEIDVVVDGDRLVLVISELASVQRRSLGRPVADIAAYEDDIRRALDRLFTGF